MQSIRIVFVLILAATAVRGAAQRAPHDHDIATMLAERFTLPRRTALEKLNRFHAGRAMIIGDFASHAEANTFADKIVSAGGRVDQIHDHRVIIAFLPPAADEAIRSQAKVRAFIRQPVDLTAAPFADDEVAHGVARYFNRTLVGLQQLLRDRASTDLVEWQLPGRV